MSVLLDTTVGAHYLFNVYVSLRTFFTYVVTHVVSPQRTVRLLLKECIRLSYSLL